MKILFNTDRLIGHSSKTPARSGVFFATISILNEFQKKYDVILYTDHKSWASIKFNKTFSSYKLIEPKNPLAKLCSFGFLLRTWLDPYRKHKFINLLCKSITYSMILLDNLFSSKINHTSMEGKICFFSSYSNIKLKQNNKLKTFTLLHDAIPYVFQDYHQEKKAFRRMIVKNLNIENHYFANSQYTKDDFLRLFPDKLCEKNIKVTHLGASQNFFYNFDIQKNTAIREKYKLPKDKKYIFSLCTLEPRKNLIFVINNFIQLLEEKQIEDMIFVLGGGYRDSFISKIKQTTDKYQDKIIHIGYVDDEDLSNLFSHSLCSIYLSLYEGFGLPVLESMQCGCPVIASNTTSIPEIVEDSGMLIDPLDSIALKKAILELYENPKLRDYYRNKGLERAKQFSWEKCANEMLEYMQKIIDQKGEK